MERVHALVAQRSHPKSGVEAVGGVVRQIRRLHAGQWQRVVRAHGPARMGEDHVALVAGRHTLCCCLAIQAGRALCPEHLQICGICQTCFVLCMVLAGCCSRVRSAM